MNNQTISNFLRFIIFFSYHQELNHYVIHHQAKTFSQSEVDQQPQLFPKEYNQNDFDVSQAIVQ